MNSDTDICETIGDCLRVGLERLTVAGIAAPGLDVRLLLAEAIQKDTTYLFGYPEKAVSRVDFKNFCSMITRRIAREPVSRIIGHREFWSIPFIISPDTLDPRPDSETLISAVLERIEDKTFALKILDLGTGSGCLLLTLLSELPNSTGLGVDRSEGALKTAKDNAVALNLNKRSEFISGNWCDGLIKEWDIIISNPPYIGCEEKPLLEPEVLDFDPPTALFADEGGMKDYRALIPQASRVLNRGGLLVIEAGQGQADEIIQLMSAAGLTPDAPEKDLGGIVRACVSRKAI